MELNIVSWILNGLLGLVMYFMRQAHTQTKEDIREIKTSVEDVKNNYSKKEDLKEFKEDIKDFKAELWKRLDRFEEQITRKG